MGEPLAEAGDRSVTGLDGSEKEPNQRWEVGDDATPASGCREWCPGSFSVQGPSCAGYSNGPTGSKAVPQPGHVNITGAR